VTERAVVDLQRGRGRWAREGYDIRRTTTHTNLCKTSNTVDATKPQKKNANEEHLERRPGARNVDSRFQIQLQEDGQRHMIELDVDKWLSKSSNFI